MFTGAGNEGRLFTPEMHSASNANDKNCMAKVVWGSVGKVKKK